MPKDKEVNLGELLDQLYSDQARAQVILRLMDTGIDRTDIPREYLDGAIQASGHDDGLRLAEWHGLTEAVEKLHLERIEYLKRHNPKKAAEYAAEIGYFTTAITICETKGMHDMAGEYGKDIPGLERRTIANFNMANMPEKSGRAAEKAGWFLEAIENYRIAAEKANSGETAAEMYDNARRLVMQHGLIEILPELDLEIIQSLLDAGEDEEAAEYSWKAAGMPKKAMGIYRKLNMPGKEREVAEEYGFNGIVEKLDLEIIKSLVDAGKHKEGAKYAFEKGFVTLAVTICADAKMFGMAGKYGEATPQLDKNGIIIARYKTSIINYKKAGDHLNAGKVCERIGRPLEAIENYGIAEMPDEQLRVAKEHGFVEYGLIEIIRELHTKKIASFKRDNPEKAAEYCLREANMPLKAIEIYRVLLNMPEEEREVAEEYGFNEIVEKLDREIIRSLARDGEFGEAGKASEEAGLYIEAIKHHITAENPYDALRLIRKHRKQYGLVEELHTVFKQYDQKIEDWMKDKKPEEAARTAREAGMFEKERIIFEEAGLIEDALRVGKGQLGFDKHYELAKNPKLTKEVEVYRRLIEMGVKG